LPAASAHARERLLSLDVDLRLEAGEWPVTGVDRSLNRKIVSVAFGSKAGFAITPPWLLDVHGVRGAGLLQLAARSASA
jgi:hypothetical protein